VEHNQYFHSGAFQKPDQKNEPMSESVAGPRQSRELHQCPWCPLTLGFFRKIPKRAPPSFLGPGDPNDFERASPSRERTREKPAIIFDRVGGLIAPSEDGRALQRDSVRGIQTDGMRILEHLLPEPPAGAIADIEYARAVVKPPRLSALLPGKFLNPVSHGIETH
jgi:hypothetical protein